MTEFDTYLEFAMCRANQVVMAQGCRPLDRKQAEALGRYISDMQDKIDDLSDRVCELEAQA